MSEQDARLLQDHVDKESLEAALTSVTLGVTGRSMILPLGRVTRGSFVHRALLYKVRPSCVFIKAFNLGI